MNWVTFQPKKCTGKGNLEHSLAMNWLTFWHKIMNLQRIFILSTDVTLFCLFCGFFCFCYSQCHPFSFCNFRRLTFSSILVVVAALKSENHEHFICTFIKHLNLCNSTMISIKAWRKNFLYLSFLKIHLSSDICLLNSSRSPRVRLLSHETPTVSEIIKLKNIS